MYTANPKSGSAFDVSAKEPGLHIWRVEKMKPVSVPDEMKGIFYSGDSYLVLYNGPDEHSNLHIWIGQNSSRDEQGACALLSTHLNSIPKEKPIQYREVQGNESDVFMEYFPHGIKYQEGGVESAFTRTQVNHEQSSRHQLYQVKGKKNIRAVERELSWTSFNTGDCFILDLGEKIFAWYGGKSNILERNKARDFATAIRDTERKGKAKMEIVVDGEEPAEMTAVLGPKPVLKEGTAEEDIVADQKNAIAAVLYKVSDMTGKMSLTTVSESSPFLQDQLITDDCFILDNGQHGKIFVWKGLKANEQEQQAALRVAENFISQMKYPQNTQVQILPQGRESLLFKQFFTNWK
ncbi:macrophage-capping protein isoform X1 [Pantherophis guttatus]|uniref:Macrophage-capping protein n=2 Tax=Pantherophis guttatus TaxID=94885 RepID=A0A6P9D9E9_PANGU|nr:macrophage-capping protein isoform X1 [Pantherophis guttatus]